MDDPVSSAPSAWRQLADWWRPRRLTLAGLSLEARILAVGALVVWLVSAAGLVAVGTEADLPGGTDNVALRNAEPLLVSRAVIVLAYVGLGTASAAIAFAAARTRSRWRRPALFAVGLVGVGLGGSLVELGGLVSTFNEIIVGRELFWDGTATVVRVLGAAAMVAGAATALVPARIARRWQVPAAAVAAAPFGCGLFAYVYVRVAARGEVPESAGVAHPQELAAQALVALVAGAGFVVAALLLWQTVVGARASRDIGLGAGRASRRWLWLVPSLLGLKAVWLLLGYLDLLPAALGGDFDSWEYTRNDDWLSWLIVAAMAAGIAAYLLLGRQPGRGRESEPTVAAASVAAGFVAFLLAATLALFVVSALGVIPDSEVRKTVKRIGDWFADGLLTSQVVVVYASGFAGAAALFLRRWRLAAIFLVLFFAWALPRLIDITIHGENLPDHSLGRVELATLDTALTAALVVVWLAWHRRPNGRDAAVIAIVLVAATAVVYTGQILGSVWASGAFYVGLIFPAAYRFLFEAGPLNRAGQQRETNLLAVLGVTAVLLVIATVQLDSDFLSPESTGTGALGRILLVPPLVAVLLAIAIQAQSRGDASNDDRPTQAPI
jgi:hypothetical protein